MMLFKYSAVVAAFALYGQVGAGPCKPISRATSSGLETSGTATTEASLTATSSLAVETSATVETSSAATSVETTFSSEVLSTTGDSSTLFTSTTETASPDATTTEFVSTTTDVSKTATATTSAAPVCEFTGEYTNYVKNPTFDNLDGNGQPTADPWIILGVSTLSTEFPRTGARSMEYLYPDTSISGSSAILQELTNTVAGHEYVFKFHWALTEGQPLEAEACRIGTMAGSDGANRLFIAVDGDQAITQDVYHEQEYRFAAENDNQRLSIGFFCTSQPSAGAVKIQIDDISVYDYHEGCESP
ncbi:uncharacterized protein FSUBG_11540 [Fusarium subglutinans]|uniref:CBM-cenC domain-containing protein n=1 Tax=Gibberella subglutinans TaxID=42677 RepID=A0A8H5P5Z0_GIBSU|nr:uncharacterized protein FSUBG_11540 [Fusarium subglutinans]KAF5588325.1 hypothetical protein FSUBG_11540 [Fusarium subglutinans]